MKNIEKYRHVEIVEKYKIHNISCTEREKKTNALQLFTEHCFITDKHVLKKQKKNLYIYIFTLKHRSALLLASFVSTRFFFHFSLLPTFSTIVIVWNQKLYILFRWVFQYAIQKKEERTKPKIEKNKFKKSFQLYVRVFFLLFIYFMRITYLNKIYNRF